MQVLNAKDVEAMKASQEKSRTIKVDAWGTSVRIKRLMADEILDLNESVENLSNSDYGIEFCARTIVGDDGSPLFDDDSGREYLRYEVEAVPEIMDQIMALHRLSEESDSAKKNG